MADPAADSVGRMIGIRVVCAGLVAALLAPGVSSSGPEPVVTAPVVVVGIAGLTWDNLTEDGTPTLWRMLEDGAGAAAMTVRTVHSRLYGDPVGDQGCRRRLGRPGRGTAGLGLRLRSDELVEWKRRFEACGVEYTPIRDTEFGYHLNFRDPDDIALDLTASDEIMAGWFAELRDRAIPREEIDRCLHEYLATT